MIKVAFLVPDNRQEFDQLNLPAPVFGPAPQALLDGFAQLTDCEVHVLFCLKQPLPVPEKIAPNIYAHGLVVGRHAFTKTLYSGCVRAIRKEIRRLGVNVVHGQGSERYPALCAALSGSPNVITIHGNMRELARFARARPFSFPWIAARLEGYAVRRSNGVVCISSYTERLVKKTARRTWLTPNAVDESFFGVERHPVDPPEIVCVANVLPHKNQIALIRALDPLAEEVKFKLRFFGKLGDDAYSQEFLELAKGRAWCEGPRPVNHAGLREQLARASLLVLPSRQDNCPMAILEAMAAGLPVAAAEIGGIPDLVEPSVTGWMFDPLDPKSIGDAVRRLLIDSTGREKMGLAARSAANRFRPKIVAARHLEIYRELVALPRR
jgi:glycosyltransferase involved in cell wall biosynthesis